MTFTARSQNPMIHPLIKPYHLDGLAYLYLRQSSPGQVRRNREGRLRQEAMFDRVVGLGWPPTRIKVLGGDSGITGSSQHGRSDLQEILEAIVSGKVGLVAARELSRLVRDNQDWSRVVRLCRFEDVLLTDEHRLYNPGDAQDRMVLGVQGAFNEFELSMIIDRMQTCLQQKARRGEQYDALPPGYICRHPPLCEKHPDPAVQRAVEKVLGDFQRFPSVHQLYVHLLNEKFQLPVVNHGRDWRDIEWVEPSYGQILELVRNPAYAGLYVRGRRKAVVSLDADGHKQTKRKRVPQDQWAVFLENHHDPYITRKEWERNVEKIAANANVRGALAKGAVGRGCSLMAGLLRCRRCGHRLQARYSSSASANGVRYMCCGGDRQRMRGGARCLAFSAGRFESLLADEILEVVGPAGVEAAEHAAQRMAAQHQQQRQLLIDRYQAAIEAEQRAAREYKETDVTYTAVRRTLGTEWENALARVEVERSRLIDFDQQRPTLPTPSQREQLARLGDDVRQVWNHPSASSALKQQLTRALIREIVADIDEERDEVLLLIHWFGGHHTLLRQPRSNRRGKLSSDELRSLIETLRKVLDDASLAAALNREQIRAGDGQTWTRQRVHRYRQRAGITGFDAALKETSGWLTQSETATRLKISPMSVHRLVGSGILPAEQPNRGLPMVISASDLRHEDVQRAVLALKSGHTRPLPDDPRQTRFF
jgi:DNA invertase Pin-like site-specific DNA recombinase